MDSEALPPIPTPPGQRWREFRIQIMPLAVFGVLLLALYFTWANLVQPMSVVGLVETNSVTIITTQAGLLTGVDLTRFDEVTNGQVIGQVEMFDPEQTKAQLAALASGAAVLNAKADLQEWGKLDNAIIMKQDLRSQQMQLEIAKVNFVQASNVVWTDEQLMKPATSNSAGGPTVTLAAYHQDVAKRDALLNEVVGRSRLVESWTKELEHIGPVATNIFVQLERVLKADVVNQQEQLLQLQKPIILRAPIAGKITTVFRHSGERVPAGAPIVAITSGEAKRIIAFVRQPINARPKVGDLASVRTRTTRRKISEAQIVKVGSQLEPINAMLLPITKPPPELGLPIALTLPPELNLLPGEIVDIRLSRN